MSIKGKGSIRKQRLTWEHGSIRELGSVREQDSMREQGTLAREKS